MKDAVKFIMVVLGMVAFLALSFGGVFYCAERKDRKDRLSQGCGKSLQRIENVERVLTDMQGCYELLTVDPQSKEVGELQFCGFINQRFTTIRLLADVLPEQSMWANHRFKEQDANGYCSYELDIHIHSAKDINGGGWQRTVDKHTQKGAVEVVE